MFVSSGTTLDRLHALDRSDRVHVSNSLPAVLSVANGSLDPRYTGYRKIGRSIMHGLDRYEREVPTTVGTIRLTYFNNLGWDGRSLCERPKPEIRRALGSYLGYRSFIDEALRRIADNAAATERARPLQLISTISSGYDSPTVTVLARGVGCQESFGFDRRAAATRTTAVPRSRRCSGSDTTRSRRLHGVPSRWRRFPSSPRWQPAVRGCCTRGPSHWWTARWCSRGTTATRSGARNPRTPATSSYGWTPQGWISPSTDSGRDSSIVPCRSSASARFGTSRPSAPRTSSHRGT